MPDHRGLHVDRAKERDMKIILGKTEDGREFPLYDGELLSWSIELTWADESKGFPRLRYMINAFKKYRPDQIKKIYREEQRASRDFIFGHNAKKVLKVMEEEGVGNA